jgi:activator of HSP90 ATPase
MKTKTINQTIKIKADAHDVYEALMDSRKHSKFTGGAAEISREVGGSFSVFDGYASGTNIELIPDKKIVQSWKAEEEGWPENHLSRITIVLKEAKGVTTLDFTHGGVPEPNYEDISQGWKEYYWEPLKKMLEKK